jgi:NAD(P)-dependent dehydrogenase (short-subunit alcohol dehydrogenase family)
MMRLKDRVAVVTGSARGMGRVFALRLAREGARVALCDILDCGRTTRDIETAGGEVLALRTDVASEKETEEMARRTFERFGSIGILINNAAVMESGEGKSVPKPVEQIAGREWDRMLDVNVKGVFLCCRAVIPYMKEQRSGRIINIASTGAFVGMPRMIHYGTTKGALITLTRSLAAALGDFNITVNAVAPGLVMTEILRSALPEEQVRQIVNTQLIRKEIDPEDVAGAVAFLASDDARMITGQILAVNAGEYLH